MVEKVSYAYTATFRIIHFEGKITEVNPRGSPNPFPSGTLPLSLGVKRMEGKLIWKPDMEEE